MTYEKEDIHAEIRIIVERKAKKLKYNDAATLASYATSSVPKYRDDAEKFVIWRDQVWTTVLSMTDADPSPSFEDVVAALPEWPDA